MNRPNELRSLVSITCDRNRESKGQFAELAFQFDSIYGSRQLVNVCLSNAFHTVATTAGTCSVLQCPTETNITGDTFGMCSTVEPQEQSENFNFGFGPILSWLRVTGVDLKKEPAGRCRILYTFVRIGWFLLCVSIHLTAFVDLSLGNDSVEIWIEERQSTRTFALTNVVDAVNMFILATGIHFCLLFPLRSRWDNLWRSLEDMRHLAAPDFDRKLRKTCFIGVAYITLSVEY